MRRTTRILSALVLALVALLSACSGAGGAPDNGDSDGFRFVSAQPAGQVIPVADRKPFPQIDTESLDGSTVDLDQWRGKVVVLNFFASWCPPCRVESPEFQEVYAAFKAKGVQFVGVGVKDEALNLKSFVDAKGITYPTVFDPASEVALALRDYPANAIPSTIVIDRDGRVAAAYIAAVSKKDITTTVTTLLGES